MSRISAIKGTEGEKGIDYSSLPLKEIQKRIKTYEKKFGSFPRVHASIRLRIQPARRLSNLDRQGVPLGRDKTKKGHNPLHRQGRQKEAALTQAVFNEHLLL
jgi:hypothetical protein